MLKPVSGVVDFYKEDITMLDLSSGSPDPEAISCLFEECQGDLRVVMSTRNFLARLKKPHLTEAIKYRTMADTETYKEIYVFMGI